MTYICTSCGNIFEEGEERIDYTESYEEDSDRWITTTLKVCPSCGSRFYERAVRCDECFGYFLEDDLTDGLCQECHDFLEEELKKEQESN